MVFPIFNILKKVSAGGIPTDGLVAEYLFSGNPNDTSGNGYHGIVNGASLTTDRNANANSAYSFDGNDYIDIDAALAGLSTNTSGTFSFWIKPVDATPASVERLINFTINTTATQNITSFIFPNGRFVCACVTGSLRWFLQTDDPVFSDNTWSHIALVQDGVSPVIHINDVVVDQGITSANDITAWFDALATQNRGRIGNIARNSVEEQFFKGDIDDIRLYNRDLIDEELTILADE